MNNCFKCGDMSYMINIVICHFVTFNLEKTGVKSFYNLIVANNNTLNRFN